ncbi:hypothetical protein K469DRAFT_722042, partial [Zopfia rhizophila CBS 207.26]
YAAPAATPTALTPIIPCPPPSYPLSSHPSSPHPFHHANPPQVRLRFHPACYMQLLLPLPHQNPVRIHRCYHHPRIHTTTYTSSCIALDDGDGRINQLGIGNASDDKGSNLFEFAPAAISSSTRSMTIGYPKKEMGLW